MDVSGEMITEIKRKLYSKRSVDIYNACIDIRKKVIKTPRGIDRLVRDQVIPVLLGILKRTSDEQARFTSSEDSYKSKIKDIICSILGNLCMETSPREEMLKHDGVNIMGNTLCTTEVEAIQNRCCRCIANMCLSPSAWKLVHDSEVVEKIVKLLKDSENPECQQTYIRAIRLLGQTGSFVQKLLDKDALSAVMKYVDSDSESVARSALVCVSHLVTRKNTVQVASQVILSGKLPQLVSVVMATETSHDAFFILVDLSEQHNFRPAFGNAGGITLFKNLLENPDFTGKEKVISVLCLCCKEAVNRVKLREEGVLKLFIEFLKDDLYKALHLRIMSALVCFLYDEASFDILLENGLVPMLVMHLRKYLDEDVSLKPIDKKEQDILDNQDSAKTGNEIVNHSKTDSNKKRINTDGTLLKIENKTVNETYNLDKCANNEQLPNSDLSKQSEFENIQGSRRSKKKNKVEKVENQIPENESVTVEKVTEVSVEDSIDSEDPLSLSVACNDENKPSTSKGNQLYSIDSPTYEAQAEDNPDYSSGAKCKRSFTPPRYLDSSDETYSPISNISYYSPVKSSPEYSPQSDRSTSPVSSTNLPLYSYCGLGSPYDEHVSSPDSGIGKYSVLSPKSAKYQPTNMEADQTWSWSPGESQDSSSDDELSAHDEKTDLNINDFKIKETKPDCSENSAEEKNVFDEKKTSNDSRELFSVVTEDGEEKPQKTCKKRKKSDNAMENNILILLSRVSQMTNPTVHFVTKETITCLLDYITEMEAPLARSARLLSRVFRNPHCFQKLLMLKIPAIIYQKLLQNLNIPEIIKRIHLFKKEEKRTSLSSGFRSRSSSISSVSSDSDRFSLFEEKTEDEGLPAKRQRGNGSGETIKREVKGVLHNQCEEVCDPGKCGMAFLEDLAGVAESPYGRGVVEKLVRQDQATRDDVCLCGLYLCRSQGTIDFFNKRDIFTNLFNRLEERQPDKFKTIVQGFSLIAHLMNFKTRYQSPGKEDKLKSSLQKTTNYVKSYFTQGSDIRESDLKDIGQGTSNDSHGQGPIIGSHGQGSSSGSHGDIDEILSDNQHSNSCKECLCTFSIPCVLHSNHTCVSKDVTFIVKGERLIGNRNTLATSSELFAAMLEGHYSESSLSEIVLSESSKFAFTYILHYLHGCRQKLCSIGNYFSSCEVSAKLTKRLIKVLKEADKYLLYDLKFELQDLLFDRYIIPEMVLNIFEYAVMYDCLKIQRVAVSCLLVDTLSLRELLLQFQKFMESKFAGVFINTLMELLLD